MNLKLHQDYSREQLHKLSKTKGEFKQGAGVWGLRGIVKIPNTKNELVFFVTLGHTEGEHTFDEGITKSGTLTWQSQPSQKLHQNQIKEFIQHDSSKSDIHLMFRAHPGRDYTYLGKLDYKWHDPDREEPVWFEWQIMDWKNDPVLNQRIGLSLRDESESQNKIKVKKNQLRILSGMPKKRAKRTGRASGKGPGKNDHIELAKSNKKLGLAGEELVLMSETHRLQKHGIKKKPKHISLRDDNAGYDIISYNQKGQELYIEVKTTKGTIHTPFFISPNELKQAKKHKSRYLLYRLYDYDSKSNCAKTYRLKGPLEKCLELTPTEYMAHYNGED